MLKKLRRMAGRHLANIGGWRTHRKIVVFESDDWGSIRMPSRQVYEKCLKAGYRVDQIAYERFDSLASEDDLELLFELLGNFKDRYGNPPVMTANILAANPDFEKIEASGYEQYFYELIPETFKKYPRHSNNINLWKEGIENGIFYPQSHGREHLNVSLFLKKLRAGDKDVLFGFENRMPGNLSKESAKGGNQYVEPLRYSDPRDKEEKLSFIVEGLDLFEELIGYRSRSFIPPNHLWSPDFDELMSAKGVQFYQGRRKMIEPLPDGEVRFHKHHLGEQNNFGQLYLVRNVSFEPTLMDSGSDPVDHTLKEIAIAFKMNKPAIICSHRLNYVGFIDERNRDNTLILLDKLLKNTIKRWPEVEFMNSAQLGRLIGKKEDMIKND